MKTSEKKIAVAFRLSPEIADELKERSRLSGIPQARILENALGDYFGEGMSQDLADAVKKVSKRKMERAKGFEPSTFTLAKG